MGRDTAPTRTPTSTKPLTNRLLESPSVLYLGHVVERGLTQYLVVRESRRPGKT